MKVAQVNLGSDPQNMRSLGFWSDYRWLSYKSVGCLFFLSSSCRNNSARWHYWHIWCKFANWLLLCSSMLGLEGTHTGMLQVMLRCSPKCCLELSVSHHSRGHFLIRFFACSVCEQWHMKVCLMLSLVSVCVSTEETTGSEWEHESQKLFE